jgi:flagellar biosynthesis protein FliQ
MPSSAARLEPARQGGPPGGPDHVVFMNRVGIGVNNDGALELASELLRLAATLSLPLLGLIVVVGLLISILQVVTQVQDPSIAFVPKLLAFGIALMLLAPWMLGKLTAYGVAMFGRLAQ